MTKDFFEDGRIEKGYTYKEYLDSWADYLNNTDPAKLEGAEKDRYEFRKLNKQRSNRIHKTYNAGDNIKSLISGIEEPQVWMVLTENWCGDSAQVLPYIAEIADLSDKIELKILLRDENLDIMDQYLTDGKSQSIPKLVAFDKDGNELFNWGPRPAEAQNFVREEMSKGNPKQEVYKELHLWYSRNKGQAIESEFYNLIEDAVTNNLPVR